MEEGWSDPDGGWRVEAVDGADPRANRTGKARARNGDFSMPRRKSSHLGTE